MMFFFMLVGSIPICISEACRLRDAVAKLIINLTLYHNLTFFCNLLNFLMFLSVSAILELTTNKMLNKRERNKKQKC